MLSVSRLQWLQDWGTISPVSAQLRRQMPLHRTKLRMLSRNLPKLRHVVPQLLKLGPSSPIVSASYARLGQVASFFPVYPILWVREVLVEDDSNNKLRIPT